MLVTQRPTTDLPRLQGLVNQTVQTHAPSAGRVFLARHHLELEKDSGSPLFCVLFSRTGVELIFHKNLSSSSTMYK